MRTTLFTFSLSLILFSSCITVNNSSEDDKGQYYEENAQYLNEEYDLAYEDEPLEEHNFKNDEGFGTKIHQHNLENNSEERGVKTHQFRDARTGLVVSSTEYPASWKVISKPSYTVDQKLPVFMIQATGPNNLRSFNTPMKIHISYQNPQTYELMRNSRSARLQRSLATARQLLEEEVMARMKKSGFHYVKNMRLPKIENYLQQKIGQQERGRIQLELLTTVWENNKNQKALVSISKIVMQQPLSIIDTMTLWMYNMDYMFVDANYFDQTLAAQEYALLNSRENQQWPQYIRLLNQQRSQIAAQKHRIHMRDRRAAFDAHQQKMKGIWAAQDANHSSFMNKTFGVGSDTSQKRFLNMINEEETVYNPNTGINYQVQAGSMEYWMDSDGNYIKNDDLFYNPNGDINLNNREWTQVRGNY